MAYQSKYTGLQIDDILDSVEWKEGKIEDLEQIRAGAQKGATALQSYTEKYTGTVTGIKINGETKSGSGVIDLGTISTDISGKVDKVAGKQLSTEDFTTALKTKLEGLNNYDDTELSEAIETLRGDFDEIVSGDTTTAIKTFNEVIAFLDGLTDTQDLESIIASIEQQIAGKMDILISGTNIKTINGQTLLGDGDITVGGEDNVQSDWNVTNSSSDAYIKNKPTIPTKVSDLENDRELVDEQFARENFIGRSEDLSGMEVARIDQFLTPYGSLLYAFPDTATGDEDDVLLSRSTVKTINGESIYGGGDLTIDSGAKVYEWAPEYTFGEDENSFSGTITQDVYNNLLNADLIFATIEGIKFPCFSQSDDTCILATGIITMFGDTVSLQIAVINNELTFVGKIKNISPTKTSQLENDSNFITSDGLKTINGESIVGSGDIAIQGGSGTITEVKANGTSVATSGVANIPAASTSAYGVTKLSSATNSTSTTLAATASAVKTAYDLANSYKGTVTGVKVNGTTKSPSSGVVDLGTVITSHQDISGKQDKLVSGTNIKTINGTSILGSGNITISGGGSSSGGSGAYSEVNHGTSDTTFALTPNTFHIWDEVANLTLTLGSETSGVANEFLFQFTSGATATSLTLPDDIKWANDSAPTIEPNRIYQVSILKGLASVLGFNSINYIRFTIDGDETIAEEGMTWVDWVSTDYNKKGLCISGGYVRGFQTIVMIGDNYVRDADSIIHNGAYVLYDSSGGN